MFTSKTEKETIAALNKIKNSIKDLDVEDIIGKKTSKNYEILEKVILITINTTDSNKVKIEAINTLNKIKIRQFIRDLYTLGEVGATEKRIFAIEQLVRLNASKAAPEIAKLLLTETIKEVKKRAIEALYSLRNPDAVYYLKKVLKIKEDKEIKASLTNTIEYLKSLRENNETIL